jgi:hypothetical protein
MICRRLVFHDGFCFLEDRGDAGIDLIDEFGEVATVFGGDEDLVGEAEGGEIGEAFLVFVVIDFVDDEEDGG